MQNIYHLQLPDCVHSGVGSVWHLTELLHGYTSIGLIVDRGVFSNPILTALREKLAQIVERIALITDVPPEPEEGQVRDLFAQLESTGCEVIVAIGGGSVMDTAKLLSVMLTNPHYRNDLTVKENIHYPGVKLITVPTSAGTGSEATPNAIVLIPEKKVKVGIVHPYFLPSAVILDPELTVTMPPSVTAATGVDAFCHCIETYISKKTNPFAQMFALEGLRLITANLRKAYNNGSDMQAREAMLLAAFYGGVAISASSTVAVHALSYPLGGSYRIPHGISNAILLTPVMRYNMDALGEMIFPIAEAMGIRVDGKSVAALEKEVISAISSLVQDVNIPDRLTGFGVKLDDVDFLTESASQVHRLLDQNPKTMTKEDIRKIYSELL